MKWLVSSEDIDRNEPILAKMIWIDTLRLTQIGAANSAEERFTHHSRSLYMIVKKT
jgi:hypothetical protein